MIKILLSLGILATVSACSFAPIGENTFNCNRGEGINNPYCRSPKALLNSTNGDLPETKYSKSFDMNDYDQAVGYAAKPGDSSSDLGSPGSKSSGKGSNTGSGGDLAASLGLMPHQMTGNNIIEGAPVRAAPVIQRVYIKPWVDENDILHEGSLTYKEVQAAKWTGFNNPTAANNLVGNAGNYPHRPPGASKNLFSDAELEDELTNGQVTSKPFAQPTPQVTNVNVGSQAAPLPAGIGSDSTLPR